MNFEESSKEEKKIPIKKVAEILLIAGCLVGIVLENSVQNRLIEMYYAGELSPFLEAALIYFFNHIGDVFDGFMWYVYAAALPGLLDLLNKKSENPSSLIFWFVRAYVVMLGLGLSYVIVDAETTQELTKRIAELQGESAGVPDILDIPFGLFGVMGGVAAFDLFVGFRWNSENQGNV